MKYILAVTNSGLTDRIVKRGTIQEICKDLLETLMFNDYIMNESELERVIGMLEEIMEENDPIFLQWYLKGTLEWHFLVDGSFELIGEDGSLYNCEQVNNFVYA